MRMEAVAAPEPDGPAKPGRASDGMAGLAKGIAILEAFGRARTPLTISEVSRQTELSKPAARRCLLTLTELGYLRFDGRRFQPTRRVLRLGASYLNTEPLNSIAQPYLDALRDRLQESVAMTIWDEGETVIIARADANRLLALRGSLGRRMPSYCTASGRILLAALDYDSVDTLLVAQPPQAFTDQTVTDPALIRRAVDCARTDRYSVVDSEIEIGFLAVAAPVVNESGETVAALSVNSNSLRVTSEAALRDFLPPLLEAAERISELT